MAFLMVSLLTCAVFADDAAVNGGPPEPYRVDNGYPTSWSSPSSLVLYTKQTNPLATQTDVWVYNPSEKTSTKAANDAANACWSPRGDQFVYWRPFRNGLFCLEFQNSPFWSHSTRVNVYSQDNESVPYWASNGIVYFTEVKDGKSRLSGYVIREHKVIALTTWCVGKRNFMDPYRTESGSVLVSNAGVGILQLCFTADNVLQNVDTDIKEWELPFRNPKIYKGATIFTDTNGIHVWNGTDLDRVFRGYHPVLNPAQDMIAFASWSRDDGKSWYIMMMPEIPKNY